MCVYMYIYIYGKIFDQYYTFFLMAECLINNYALNVMANCFWGFSFKIINFLLKFSQNRNFRKNNFPLNFNSVNMMSLKKYNLLLKVT